MTAIWLQLIVSRMVHIRNYHIRKISKIATASTFLQSLVLITVEDLGFGVMCSELLMTASTINRLRMNGLSLRRSISTIRTYICSATVMRVEERVGILRT